MSKLRDGLFCLFLGLLSVFIAKCIFLADQVQFAVADVQGSWDNIAPSLTEAAFALRATAHTIQEASRQQASYYKAGSKAAAIAAVQFARLIEHTDAAVQNFSENTDVVLADTQVVVRSVGANQAMLAKSAGETLSTLTSQTKNVGSELALAADAIRTDAKDAGTLLNGPVSDTLTATASSAKHVERSTESVEIALEPLRKASGRFKAVLRWLLGLPKYSF